MHFFETLFWVSFSILIYTYFGYACLLWILTRFFKKKEIPTPSDADLPRISHLITAYNEQDCIEHKIKNALTVDYPSDKLVHVIVADGSTDNTVKIVEQYPKIQLFYTEERKGKLAAVNRVLPLLNTDIVFLVMPMLW